MPNVKCARRIWWPAAVSIVIANAGCHRNETETLGDPLTVYCSVDEGFARAILDKYARRESKRLDLVFDSEAGKTTGLVRRILREAESGRPRADVFWSSELFHTIELARRELLEPYDSPAAVDIPSRFKDEAHRWTALAVRARVLAFDPTRTDAAAVPTRWEQLAEPIYAGRLAFANPLFGTTQGHVAAMFALWGPTRARAFLEALKEHGTLIADGNSTAVRAVIGGRAAFAATDSDDVWVARRSGASLDSRYLDMGDGGALLIPCSVSIVRGTAHRRAAQRLVDYLVSSDVERSLAQSDSHNIPVRASLREQLGVTWPSESRLGFDEIADAMNASAAAVREILIR